MRMIKQRTGELKVSLNVAVKESTHRKLQQVANNLGGTMGSWVDELVKECLSMKGVRR